MPVANLDNNFVLNVAAVRQNNNIARLYIQRAICATFIGKRMKKACTPVIEMPGFICKPVLAHYGVLATLISKVCTGLAGDSHLFCILVQFVGVQQRLFQTRRRLQGI